MFSLSYELAQKIPVRSHYAALRAYDSSTTTPSDPFKLAVQNMVVYGNPAGGTSPVTRGLQISSVNVIPTFTNNVPSAMTVSITGYTIDAVFGTTTLNGKPVVTYAYQGNYAPY